MMEPFALTEKQWQRIADSMRGAGIEPGEPDRKGIEGLIWASNGMRNNVGRGQTKEAAAAFRDIHDAVQDLLSALHRATEVGGGADLAAFDALGVEGATRLPAQLAALSGVALGLEHEAENEPTLPPRTDPAAQWLDGGLWRLWCARLAEPDAPVCRNAVAFFDEVLRAAGRDMGADNEGSGAKRAAQRAKRRNGYF